MKHEFWLKKWQDNQIGFHRSDVNPMLVKYVDRLNLSEGNRVFLPLCGKTLDIHGLLDRGFRVAGAELSETAVEQLFTELDIVPDISQKGALKHYHGHKGQDIDIFVGDIFELDAQTLGDVHAVYDRAALVALPPEMRKRYTAHLLSTTHKAPQLLLCFEYDQSLRNGPPFSIPDHEVTEHYGAHYHLQCLETHPVPGGIGGVDTEEKVWLLSSL